MACDKSSLGPSKEIWATVTELVCAGGGHLEVVPVPPQRDDASTFMQGLGGTMVVASVGLSECSYFMGKKKHEMVLVLTAERNQVLYLRMQCGVVTSSANYTFRLCRSLNFI